MLSTTSQFLPTWNDLRGNLWNDLIVSAVPFLAWLFTRYKGLSARWQTAWFITGEVLLALGGVAAISRFGAVAVAPSLAVLVLPLLLFYWLEKRQPGSTQSDVVPHLPPGFSIRMQELRGGSNPLAPHVLWLELQVSTAISGHRVRFFCDGPIYREACHFLHGGIDIGVGATEAGPTTSSIVLRVGGRGFAAPGILVVELASVAPLKLLRIEDEPYFDAPIPSAMPSSRGGFADQLPRQTSVHNQSEGARLQLNFIANEHFTGSKNEFPAVSFAAGEVPTKVGFLVVHNIGVSPVKCRARISVHTGIADWPSGDILAVWYGYNSDYVEIQPGFDGRIIVAVLLRSSWTYYRWSVPYRFKGKASDANTVSLIGSNQDLRADITITVMPDPPPADSLPIRHLVLEGDKVHEAA